MRLDKFLSESTEFSRKEIRELIKKGAVTVSGEVKKKPDIQVNAYCGIEINGRSVAYKKYVYLILNKPQGYVSATEDKTHKTVTELVPEDYRHFDVFPVGRLDIDTEGLLILTNDGEFAHQVTAPKKNVYKRYFARVDAKLSASDRDAFGSGMEFKDFKAMPAKLEIVSDNEAYVEIAEGKFHQVKRMFERVGKTVTYLKRVKIGELSLPDGLKTGEITESDAELLRKAIFMR